MTSDLNICQLELVEPGLVRCPECSRTLRVPNDNWKRYRLTCPGGKAYEKREKLPQSFTARARRYSGAIAKWISAGRPKRSEEEIENIYENICKPCEHYNANGSCSMCGCRITRSQRALFNKLAMATESCPVDKW